MAPCDVVIPVKDSPWWVDWCLEELLRHTDPALLGSVLVVDDGSSADCLDVLRSIVARHAGVTLVENGGRPGFGGACNFAVERTRSPLFLLLNTDCLITPGLVGKLVGAIEADPAVGMACPLSNNSPVLTLPLLPGRSYLEMNALLEEAFSGATSDQLAVDACTIIGNCLLISRRCWEATGEFDSIWGRGYGEETDFQFRAMAKGFRGVAVLNVYVFHFGSASFRYEGGVDQLKERAHALFQSKWGPVFREYARRCEARQPVQLAQARLAQLWHRSTDLDVLFILPGITQGVGGVHVVLDLCNHLVRRGLKVACGVLGDLDMSALARYQEPLLFGLLHFPDREHLLHETDVSARVVVSTLFITVPALHEYSQITGARVVSFVQGYEFYFTNGIHWAEVEESYKLADEFLTTSRWLEEGVRRHQPQRPVTRLKLSASPDVFYPSAAVRTGDQLRVAVVLRSSSDKGQWMLLEVMDRLWSMRDHVHLTVLRSPEYTLPPRWSEHPELEEITLPLGRESVAEALRRVDVLIDASLHEGFGLFPLEAMASGATVIVSASGGVQDFVQHGANGFVIREALNPDAYVESVRALVESPELLTRLRRAALDTAAQYDPKTTLDAHARFFRGLCATTGGPSIEVDRSESELVFATGEAAGYDRVESGRDALVVAQPSLLLTSFGNDPGVLLPAVTSPTPSVLRIEIGSPVETALQVYVPHGPVERGRVRSGLRAVAHAVRGAKGSYRESLSVTEQVRRGWNTLYVGLPPLQGGLPLRLDPAGCEGLFVIRSLEIRQTPNLAAQTAADERRAAFDTSDRVLTRVDADSGAAHLTTLNQVQVSRLAPCVCAVGRTPQLFVSLPVLPDGREVCIEVDVDSPRRALLRIFYGRHGTNTFVQSCSATRRLQAGHNRLRIVFADSRMDGHFRIDLETSGADVHLHRLEFRMVDAAILPSVGRHQ